MVPPSALLRALGTSLSTLTRGLAALAYPPCCLHCGRRAERPHLPLCAHCLTGLEPVRPEALRAELERLPAAREQVHHPFALWLFDKHGPLQKVQHALKYGNRPYYGYELGRLLGRGLRRHREAHPAPPLTDALVPVPLHRLRRYERGYNQSAWLARGIAEVLEVPVEDSLLARPRPTRSQARLDRAQRWSNVQRAFAAAPRAAGRHLMLVDDVLTTGSTAAAAARALRQAGAASVSLAVLALARD